MLNLTRKWLIVVVLTIMIFGKASYTVPLTFYQYVTHHEKSNQGQMIWFWTHDTLEGPVHSNDYIGLKYSPQFYGQVSTSKDRFLESQANPYFEFRPIFNAPPVEFPQNLDFLRDRALLMVQSRNGTAMTWIRMMAEHGIAIFQYPAGTPRQDSLVELIQIPDPAIIFVEGDVEVEGILFGTLTIGCSGNMYLLDDCVYDGADPLGQFDEEEMPHMLGLVSEGNVIIKNTIENGRADGYNQDRNNLDRHSIVITAALIALNESFTFEHHNNDWERYQGPEPDERGSIYFKGTIAQHRRGYFHRSNHQGTGFHKRYYYDSRFHQNVPPGFAPGENGIVSGRSDRVELFQRRNYRIRNANIGTLIVSPGVELELEGQQPIVVRDSLILRGTVDQPITVRPERERDRTLFRVARGARSYVELENVIFEESIETQIDCDSLKVTNCEFNGPAVWEGIIQVRGSKFADQATMSSWHQLLVTHSVFENGLTIAGDARDGHLINNTIVKGRGDGLRLRRFRNLEIQNNIIAFNQQGINNHHFAEPDLGYNNVFENERDDYIDCTHGEGAISSDPMFEELRNDDYRLTEGSPCIDTGNPDSPRDPDGTRADIGAYYFDHPNSIQNEFAPTNVEDFELTGIYPNPFNSTTTIGYYLPVRSGVVINVYDLAGRLQVTLVDADTNAGRHKITWSPESLSAGMYLVQMQVGEFSSIRKVMFMK